MRRLETIVAELPESERVDIAVWGDHPTFRVRGKNFVFSSGDATLVAPKKLARQVEAEDLEP